jgi:hypothetical protein
MIGQNEMNRLQDLRTQLTYLQTQLSTLISWKAKNNVSNFDRITLYCMNDLRLVFPQHKMPFSLINEIENMIQDAIADLQNEINLITEKL